MATHKIQELINKCEADKITLQESLKYAETLGAINYYDGRINSIEDVLGDLYSLLEASEKGE